MLCKCINLHERDICNRIELQIVCKCQYIDLHLYKYNSIPMRNQSQLLVEQLDRKLMPFIEAGNVQIPDKGWIFSLRNTLNMTLEQLGRKLNITRQGVKRIENSEASGTVSINLLREVGRAMDMRFVYGFIPKHGSVSNLIDKKSHELAERIIQRTDQTMMLEDQANEKEYLKTAVEDLATQIRQELRRSIWD